MEVILKKDIKGLGYKNDIVKVKGGYGRNYLIPQGYALVATEPNKKMMAELARQAAHKAEKLKQDAEELAGKIEKLTVEIKTKVGENGRIFGSVTTNQLAEVIREKGYEVDRKQIAINGEVKTTGEYEAEVDLHREVNCSFKFTVAGE